MTRRLLAAIALLAGVALVTPAAAQAVSGPPAQNFGATMIGTQSDAALALVAEYEPPANAERMGPVSISGPAAADFSVVSNGCTAAPVPAGCRLSVQFAPSTVGSRGATLHVAGQTASLDVALSGTGFVVGPRLAIAPASLEFLPQPSFGLSAAGRVALSNGGDLPVTIGVITQTGSGDFLRTADCSRSTLGPGATCTVEVRFHPTTAGPMSGTLRIPSNAPEQVDSVAMSGTVAPPPARPPAIAPSPRPTEWAAFQIFHAVARPRRITLRLFSSLGARVVVSVRHGRRTVGRRVRTSMRTGFTTVVVRGRFTRRRAYRVHVLARPAGVGLQTRPTRYSVFRTVRVPR